MICTNLDYQINKSWHFKIHERYHRTLILWLQIYHTNNRSVFASWRSPCQSRLADRWHVIQTGQYASTGPPVYASAGAVMARSRRWLRDKMLAEWRHLFNQAEDSKPAGLINNFTKFLELLLSVGTSSSTLFLSTYVLNKRIVWLELSQTSSRNACSPTRSTWSSLGST